MTDHLTENARLRAALEEIVHGYGPQHLSKYARDVARAALATPAPDAVQEAARVPEIVAEAFRAGFNESGEGWNGEYPCTAEAEEWLASESAKYAAAIRARGE